VRADRERKQQREDNDSTGPGHLARQRRRPGSLRWIATGALLVAVAAAWLLLPLVDWIRAAQSWIVDLGPPGVVLFAALYAVATVLLAPGSLLTIAAGFAYGVWGLPVAIVAATIGASLAFLVARYLVRGTVRRVLETRRNLAAIDRAVAAEGWRIVLLCRLSPIVPFNVQNYLFGVTGVPFWGYAVATFVGIAPATALFAYIGAFGETAFDGGPAKWAFFAAGLAAAAIAIALVMRKARTLLRQAGLTMPRGEPHPPQAPA
jgi:uncharacterized membrane protein YdjX (TVP38/TMEM64 family)